jgi:hypothetical protein
MSLRATWLVLAVLLLVRSAAAQSSVSLDLTDGALAIHINDKPFARYVWNDPRILRPYFAAVSAPSGQPVTRNHPPISGVDPVDHDAMHPGLWLGFGDISGTDFWRNHGRVQHVEFVEPPTATRSGAMFAVRNRYLAGDRHLCDEVCRIEIRVQADQVLLDWTSEFSGPAEFSFGDQEEMGLGVRVATPLSVRHGGQLVNSVGLKNEQQVWGQPADWCDARGEIEGQIVGIAVLSPPEQFRQPWFHARDYGLLVANPFGRKAFTGGEPSRVVVPKGETFRLRYGIVVYSGPLDVAATYRDWASSLAWIGVSPDRQGFVRQPTGQPFVPWGFNYDHDQQGRLIEDYWESEWPTVESDFAEMRGLGANVVRIHLQLGKFMDGPETVNEAALRRLSQLVALAESTGLYLNLTGLGCYHKQDVPAWYDALAEADRWAVQARFWQAVATRCARSPAIFCYDLMNEPVVPGGRREPGDWLAEAFAGKHFVQFITLDQQHRPRSDIARNWVDHLVTAIRQVDQRHLVTVGLVDWSLDRRGLTSGFVPEKIAERLDFVSVHLYPKSGQLDEAAAILKGFSIGKPVVVEEMFPMNCTPMELKEFIERSGNSVAGWFGFYWGKSLSELDPPQRFGDALMLEWLKLFQERAAAVR